MTDFDRALPYIRHSECAPRCVAGDHAACFTNNPDDPGGATCCGIIQRTYDAYRRGKGLPLQLVQKHSWEEHAELYRTLFWDKARCGELRWPLSLIHFDAAVNHGTEPFGMKDGKRVEKVNAGRLLQRAARITPADGVLGPASLAAIAAADPTILSYRYLLERLFRYDDLADQNPRLVQFQVGGWEQRIEDLYHVIEKEAA